MARLMLRFPRVSGVISVDLSQVANGKVCFCKEWSDFEEKWSGTKMEKEGSIFVSNWRGVFFHGSTNKHFLRKGWMLLKHFEMEKWTRSS